MQTFGLGTSSLYAIFLSGLVCLTFLAGLVKVWFKKRDLRKKVELAKIEASNKQTDLEKLVGNRELDEGDLFGVRAIQAGFYGGVSQSTPNSPATSRSSSVCSLGLAPPREDTIKLSPSFLQPPEIRTKSHLRKGSRPSPLQSTTSQNENPNLTGIGSPLGSHSCSRNFGQYAESDGGQQSLPPTLRINHSGKGALVVPAPPEPALKSASATIQSFAEARPSPHHSTESLEEFPRRSQSFSVLSPSPRVGPTLARNFSSNDSDWSGTKIDKVIPPHLSLTLNSLPPTAVIRDSIVSKRQVSILQPPIQSPQQSTIEDQNDSDTTSVYSARSLNFETSQTNEKNVTPSDMVSSPNYFKPVKGTRTLLSPNKTQMMSHPETRSDMSHIKQSEEPNSSCESDLSYSYLSARSSNSSSSSLSTMERLPTKGTGIAPDISLLNFEHFSDDSTTNERRNSRPTSQGSISDFYDTYFRQSILRQSTFDSSKLSEMKWRNESPISFGKAIIVEPTNTGKRVLAPKGLAKEIIVDLNPQTFKSDGYNGERYPKLISPLG
ncbi:hypothetical protein BGHDH14_bghG007132000001001 [Blumeria hordei DH14]|uniref:Uncharacterized protein n=1 Tax=Blumeria graminis f. sp. hordei (strain DH14) TaxID=546991 RepID=N1JKQ2_BLUG1|nr:hypothetical protein BGHDH14_bghG007132000001001 [Blumeria hordei DH14]